MSVPATTPRARPIAHLTVEPQGKRAKASRDHLVKLILTFSPIEPRFADKLYLAEVARRGIEGFPPPDGGPERRRLVDLLHAGKGGPVVIGVEASVLWPGRPEDERVAGLRSALAADGYNLQVREVRECTQSECLAEASVEWDRPSQVPAGWYSSTVCGRHDYRSCSACQSIYLMTSTSAMGQAPSVTCEVCGLVIVGWGGSKIWNAELVTKGSVAPVTI